MNDLTKNLLLWVVVAVVLMVVFQSFSPKTSGAGAQGATYSQFLDQVDSGNVQKVTFSGDLRSGTNQLTYTTRGGQSATINAPMDRDLINVLRGKNVEIVQEEPSSGISLGAILMNFLPVILIIGFWLFIMRQMQGGGGGAKGAMSFGKSRAKLQGEDQIKVTFADVAGCDEAKEEVGELVDFLRDPTKFTKLGGKIPRGVLMVGPPGTGKTLLARAIAGEAKVPFFSISGSDFVEMFVGVGASRVRDMFEQAKKQAPCIIFIDEIDAVGRHRGAGLGGGHDEREQTLNQLLVEMDGFEANEGVILIAATNRPDVLDPALLRPGRFDRQVVVPNPDIMGREKILKVHMRKVPLAPDVDPRVIARGTPGFSGADLANLVNEAALLAARRGKRVVAHAEFEEAKDKVMMGAERRSMVMTDAEKKTTAYHEAGHAIVGLYVPEHDPIHKATIIPRGRALGMVVSLPENDRISWAKIQMESRLAMTFGGRLAEELIFGPERVTSGASSDIQAATNLARAMVTEWGMSPKLGRLRYSSNGQEVFLGHSVTQTQNISEETAKIIDEEMRRLIEEAESKARNILTEHIDQLHLLANALLEFETLTGDEVRGLILRGEPIVRPEPNDEPPPPKRPTSGKRTSVPSGGAKGMDPEPQPGT